MHVEEAVKERRSIRKFKDKELDMEHIIEIIDAGRHAPSSGNLQAWRFILIKDQERKNELSEICFKQRWISEAPVVVVIVSIDREVRRHFGEKYRHYGIQDCACAAMSMLLRAKELGIDSCFVSSFDHKQLSEFLSLSEASPQVVLPLGYGIEVPKKKQLYDFDALVHFEHFQETVEDWDKEMSEWGLLRKKSIDKLLNKIKKVPKKSLSVKDKIHSKIKKYDSKIKDFYKKHNE